MKRLTLLSGLVLAILTLVPGLAEASEALPHIPGAELSILWAVPFACMLLSIALGPLFFAHFWEHHFGKVAVFWGMAFLVPCAIVYGPSTAIYEGLHSIILEYIPFIILLFSLFTVAGGVRLKGSLVGTPAVNTGLLLTGTVLASWMGTTGAAMLLIRPLLRANAHRKYRVHQVVFFIFLVANIGGSLTPLGDPAALPWLPEGRGLLLDLAAPLVEDLLHDSDPARTLLCHRHHPLQEGRLSHAAP